MIILFLTILLSIGVLSWSAELFVQGSLTISHRFQWSALVVGTIWMGIATTLPELFVTYFSVMKGHTGLAVGNIIGSYIVNIGLVIGLISIFIPLKVPKEIFKKEFPMLYVAVCTVLVCFYSLTLTTIDGILLLVILLVTIFWMLRSKGSSIKQSESTGHLGISILKSIFGLVLMWFSSETLIHAATQLAGLLGMSDRVIGLTVVAIGTSLPELAASFICAKKGHADMAIGNILGSNCFSLLGVLAIPCFLGPKVHFPEKIMIDLVVIILITFLLWFSAYFGDREQFKINRWEGFILLMFLLVYVSYTLVKG
jgi:cation:H+ antiporter